MEKCPYCNQMFSTRGIRWHLASHEKAKDLTKEKLEDLVVNKQTSDKKIAKDSWQRTLFILPYYIL